MTDGRISLTKIVLVIVASIIFLAVMFILVMTIQMSWDEHQRQMEIPQDIAPSVPSTQYGCPGCPSSFMDFAEDMCNRPGFEVSLVSDGKNALNCSEVKR